MASHSVQEHQFDQNTVYKAFKRVYSIPNFQWVLGSVLQSVHQDPHVHIGRASLLPRGVKLLLQLKNVLPLPLPIITERLVEHFMSFSFESVHSVKRRFPSAVDGFEPVAHTDFEQFVCDIKIHCEVHSFSGLITIEGPAYP